MQVLLIFFFFFVSFNPQYSNSPNLVKKKTQTHHQFQTMASFNFVYFLSIVFSVFISTGCVTASHPVVKASYYPLWALDNLPPSAINTSYFTHIIYAFLVPSNVTFSSTYQVQKLPSEKKKKKKELRWKRRKGRKKRKKDWTKE